MYRKKRRDNGAKKTHEEMCFFISGHTVHFLAKREVVCMCAVSRLRELGKGRRTFLKLKRSFTLREEQLLTIVT